MSSRKKVLFLGTPGVRKVDALSRLLEEMRRTFPNEHVYTEKDSAGNERIPTLDQHIYGDRAVSYLKAHGDEQRRVWHDRFQTIRNKFDHAQTAHHFLGLHLTYRYRHIPNCTANFADLVDWRPDCIVTFIDDAYCVRERNLIRGYKNFTLAELMLWRAEELLFGDVLARLVNPEDPIPNFLLPVKHPPGMLARLLLKPEDIARIYISFRMSDVRTNPDLYGITDRFRERVHNLNNLAVFDPTAIDELPPLMQAKKAGRSRTVQFSPTEPEQRWPTKTSAGMLVDDNDLVQRFPLKIPSSELLDVDDAIDAHLRQRDLRFVDQAHYLVVYRPTLGGRLYLSEGVSGELDRARTTMCPMIWYIKKGEDELPIGHFDTETVGADPDIIYEKTEDKLWERLAGLHKNIPTSRDRFLR